MNKAREKKKKVKSCSFAGRFGTTLDINMLVVWTMLTCNSSCGLYTWHHRWKTRKESSEKTKDLV